MLKFILWFTYLSRIYTECLYPDFEITFEDGSIQTHSSILKCRAPTFFSELSCSLSQTPSVVILSRVDKLSVENFVRWWVRKLLSAACCVHGRTWHTLCTVIMCPVHVGTCFVISVACYMHNCVCGYVQHTIERQ